MSPRTKVRLHRLGYCIGVAIGAIVLGAVAAWKNTP